MSVVEYKAKVLLHHVFDFLSASASVSAVTLAHAEYVAVGHGTFKGSEPM